MVPISAFAGAVEFDGLSEYSQKEVLSEMASAGAGNLDNALAGARRSAQLCSDAVRALMVESDARAQQLVQALDGAFSGAPGRREDLESLAAALPGLAASREAFEARLPAAGLPAPKELSPEGLSQVRQHYRLQERSRDLKKTEAYLAEARKKHKRLKISLGKSEAALLASVRAYRQRLQGLRGATGTFWTSVKADGEPPASLRDLEARLLKSLDQDLRALDVEERYLAAALELARHDDAAFEAGD